MATNYEPGREQYQVTAQPGLQSEKARFDPGADGMTRLLAALGTAVPLVDHIGKQYDADETAKGTAAANSMTLDDLGKMVRRGDMLQSHSQAYTAAVQHIYGQNEMERQQSDTMSKLTKGELTFNDPAAMDKYLVDQRNAALAGQSQYTIAGFDKGWDTFGKQAISANTRMNDAAAVVRGTQEATDSLAGVVGVVTAPGFSGTPADAARKLVNQVAMLDVTTVLALPGQRKEALDSTASALAGSGSHAVLKEFLASPLEGGATVSATLGREKARTLLNAALSVDDGNQHRRVDVEMRTYLDRATAGELTGDSLKSMEGWVTTNERWVTTATRQTLLNTQRIAAHRIQQANDDAAFQRQIAASVAAAQLDAVARLGGGVGAFGGPIQVMNKSGEMVNFDMQKFAEKAIPEMVAAKKMNFQQEAMLWAGNNIENPVWKSEIGAGMSNIASLGWASDGKNVGELNPAGKAALARYSELYQNNPGEAEKYAGKDSQVLGDILFLQAKGGFPDVNTAASIVNRGNHSGMSDHATAIKMKVVDSAVEDITNPKFFSLSNNVLVESYKGLFNMRGNTTINLDTIKSDVTRRAKLLVRGGSGMTEADAVKASVAYYADPAVTTQVNGTLYKNQDLPKAPGVTNANELFGRFIKTGPGALAESRGFDGNASRLIPNTDGTYTAWVGGSPLRTEQGGMVTYQKSMIEDWIKAAAVTDRQTAAAAPARLQEKRTAEVKRVTEKLNKPGAMEKLNQDLLSTD